MKRDTNLREYPGTPLTGSEKRKKLYHYTKLDTFYKIWKSKTLLFSDVKGTNDIQEADKKYTAYYWERLKQISNIVNSYKQISFALDYDSYMKGGMSNLMWGHYGDNGRGVCIELDYEKLNLGDSILHQEVSYEDKLYMLKIPSKIITPEDYDKFLLENKTGLFFTKLRQWETENEYRFVSNIEEKLDISNAVTAIWVTHNLQKSKTITKLSKDDSFSLEFSRLRRKIGNSIPIYDYFLRGIGEENEIMPCKGKADDYQLEIKERLCYKKTGIYIKRFDKEKVNVWHTDLKDGKLYNHDELIKIGKIFYPDKKIFPRSFEELHPIGN